jgi:uncharacterized protein (TIGR00369 family)
MDTRAVFDRWSGGAEPPIATLIGFRMVTYEHGFAVFEMEAGPEHANPMGTLHGGVLCDIADAAMGTAMATTLGEGESMTTVELKINFMKPVWKALLRAEGRVVKRGRTIALLECDITDPGKSLVARASSTYMVLRGEQAKGR